MSETLDRDKLQNMFVIGVALTILIFLLAVFFGVKYYYKPSPGETHQYNSFTFVKKDALWYTNWQRNDKIYEIGLHYLPPDVENIPVLGTLNESFNNKNRIYISFDPFSDKKSFKYLALAASELSTNLAEALGRQPFAACTRGEQLAACKERPIVTCDNTDLNVIIIKEEEPTQIVLNNTCITIQGKEYDLIKTAEKTLYTWFRIIKNPIVPLPPSFAS